jgi:hypothetical protein
MSSYLESGYKLAAKKALTNSSGKEVLDRLEKGKQKY